MFIETAAFRQSAAGLLDEDDLAALQALLLVRPSAGVVIPGSGGLRKIRVPAKGKGRRGGGRVIYFCVRAHDQIFLLYAYAKNERQDITPKQARLLRSLVEE